MMSVTLKRSFGPPVCPLALLAALAPTPLPGLAARAAAAVAHAWQFEC